jgi:conflict system pore-forming effector with SLATT domain
MAAPDRPRSGIEVDEEGTPVFELTLFDHLRMTFGHIVHRHRAHAELAQSRSRWDRALRIAEVVFIVGVLVTALAAVYSRVYWYSLAAAVLSALALVVLLCHLTLDLDRSAQAHAACATRMWHLRERYRALLSDLHDGALGVDAVRRKRDELIAELRQVYEDAPPVERKAYQTAGQALRAEDDDKTLSDEEIDKFLPKSLQAAKTRA